VVNLFQRGSASVTRIDELLKAKPTIDDSKADPSLAGIRLAGDIEFRNLSLSYGNTPVLKDINLRIPEGTSLAIVGPTGCGKTTLVSLLPRLHDAPDGQLLLDGRSIREYPLDTLRANVGFVPQETFLFSETIAENIRLGAPAATEQDIEQAATAAHIAEDIRDFPRGFQTMVGERGITLSGGQKQRTAIARALVRDPRILILDDALSSVDTYTEERILEDLRQRMLGRTTIFISHRVSTVQHADQIAVLMDGRVVELGTHDQLIAKNGYYTSLWQKQQLEEELAVAG
jgi:ATP-binding cassette subfamily B protein